jgi:CBS domain containing-hemolysin-like protein
VVRGTEGEPVGMVSLEDLLEQLVGDIRDESDLPVRRDRA